MTVPTLGGKSLTASFQADMDPGLLRLFGMEPKPAPTYALMFDQEHEVSGKPDFPAFRGGLRGFWDVLSGKELRVMRKYRRELKAWIDAGRPSHKVTVRTIIPRARLESVE